MIAAAVSSRNSSCGSRRPVEDRHRQDRVAPEDLLDQGLSPVEKPPRTAPTRMSGAVSPSARDSGQHGAGQDARMPPQGRTSFRVTSQRDAPTP